MSQMTDYERARLRALESKVESGYGDFIAVADAIRLSYGMPLCSSLDDALDVYERHIRENWHEAT